MIDDVFFGDGFHPSLNGYTVLAQAILTGLHSTRFSAGPPTSHCRL